MDKWGIGFRDTMLGVPSIRIMVHIILGSALGSSCSGKLPNNIVKSFREGIEGSET